jgi:hypothetical protein
MMQTEQRAGDARRDRINGVVEIVTGVDPIHKGKPHDEQGGREREQDAYGIRT